MSFAACAHCRSCRPGVLDSTASPPEGSHFARTQVRRSFLKQPIGIPIRSIGSCRKWEHTFFLADTSVIEVFLSSLKCKLQIGHAHDFTTFNHISPHFNTDVVNRLRTGGFGWGQRSFRFTRPGGAIDTGETGLEHANTLRQESFESTKTRTA